VQEREYARLTRDELPVAYLSIDVIEACSFAVSLALSSAITVTAAVKSSLSFRFWPSNSRICALLGASSSPKYPSGVRGGLDHKLWTVG